MRPVRRAFTLIELVVAITIIGSIATFLHAFLSFTIVNRTITGVRREAFATTLRAPLRAPEPALSEVGAPQ